MLLEQDLTLIAPDAHSDTASISYSGVQPPRLSDEEEIERLARLETLMLTDAVTGLYNWRGFLGVCETTLLSTRREGNHLAVVKFGGYRNICTGYGRPIGNALLRRATLVLCSAIETGDVIGRVGADLFAVLLTGCTPERAANRCAAIADRLGRAYLPHGDLTLPLSADVDHVPLETANLEVILTRYAKVQGAAGNH